MDANQIEKLKALALAAGGREWIDNGTRIQERRESGEPPSDERLVWWYDFEGDTKPEHLSHVAASNPAAVLELIAEVERLRAELAAGAAKGSNASECVGCEGSPSGSNNPCAVCSGSAPAVGTAEKDAERYRWLKERFTGYDFYWGGTPPYEEDADKGKCVIVFECGQGFCAGRDFEAGIDAAIEAHTKAGKDNA